MDPPYQGVCNNRDPRYYSGIDSEELLHQLRLLISRKVRFLLSYDGRKGQKAYGVELPAEIGLYKMEIRAGRSSQSTLLGRDDMTYESVYLSEELVNQLGLTTEELESKIAPQSATQLVLPIVEN
jgi:DNA adenine methylase